ncbi:MAG: tetratricopeptide repeat protein [Nocardiopsaceae bacterium]|nr:tetratricopeptide repeat protein [Nocardiopsaceae bacterium]
MQQPRDFSLYGAVDLGARQAAAQRRQQTSRAAGPDDGVPPAGGTSAQVIDVTEENFNNEVVLRSRNTPVIVDLWADWCQPCKQLSPVLEKLAGEAAGGWTLAKIDVEANQQVAAFFFQRLQTQSIPLVVAIVDGQLVSAFPGAIPEAQIREWLGQVLQVAEQLGVGTGAGDVADAVARAAAEDAAGEVAPSPYEQAQEAMASGDLDGAVGVLEKALAESPADSIAKGMLAQVKLVRRVDSYDAETARRDAAANPSDVEAQTRVADIELATGQAEDAFARLLGVIGRTSGEERNSARLHLLDLFEIFGPEDPVVKKARAKLAALLF